MDTVKQDLRFALRSLSGTPGFTIAALLTLALGIGANAAIFSVVDGVLLRPTPVDDIDRVVMVWETDRNSGTTREPSAVPDFLDFRQRSTQFAALEVVIPAEVNLTPEGADPRRAAALAATPGLLPMLGIRPLVGRLFTEAEGTAGNNRVVVISEGLWESVFARAPDVIGRDLRLDDAPFRVVGVVAQGSDFGMLQLLGAADYQRGFAARGTRVDVDAWTPFVPDPAAPRHNHPVIVMGRLADGATVAGAQAEMSRIATDLEQAYPSNAGRGVFVEPFSQVVFGGARTPLLLLLGAVALVLLVACGNVANLMLARNSARRREVTVRVALGASRRRIVQQFLVEAAVLTGAGALLGVLVADWGLRILLAIAPPTLPRLQEAGVDVRVLLAAGGLTVLVTIFFGLLPTLQTRRVQLQEALHDAGAKGVAGGTAQRRWRSVLVVGQLAMAVMLMVSAGLLVRSLWELQRVDPGFAAAGVLKAEYQLPASRYPRDMSRYPDFVEQRQFNAELQSRLASLPGVTAATIAVNHPLDGGFTSSIRVVGREAEAANWPEPAIRIIGSDYLETMRVPVQAGRGFLASDEPGATPTIIVNEAARRRYFDTQDPIGQQIFLWGANRTVVGVIGDERIHGVDEATPPSVYLPIAQAPTTSGSHTLLVRTAGAPSAAIPAVRQVVRELDPMLPLFAVEPLIETLSGSLAQQRFTMFVLGAFALVALLLAVVGVHGVLSYMVTMRTREIGIRVALGAAPSQVQRSVVSEGALLAVIGLAIGLAGAFALTRVMTSLLYGIGSHDPLTYVVVALLLGVTALVACLVPARRAARVDPVVALRAE